MPVINYPPFLMQLCIKLKNENHEHSKKFKTVTWKYIDDGGDYTNFCGANLQCK